MKIQCIALDLDRTTLDARARLSEENRRALEYAIGKGVHVVIASGRAFSTLPKDVTEIPGVEYAITSNGAAVYHIPSGACLHRYTLPEGAAEKILQLTGAETVSYEAFVEGQAYGARDYVENPEKYGATPGALAYVKATRRIVPDIRAFILAHRDALDSVDVVVRDGAQRDRLWAALKAGIPEVYITSSVDQLLEISHHQAGKHSGLAFILDRLGLPREAAAAFGDGDNDADLLHFAGCGIAVANASPACLAAADHVTKAHDAHGVAHGIFEILKI